jgi:ubiquinone/menaquinone biosynthesis C-methylase UbiE
MSSPWLGIPLDDYENHMSLPTVQQAGMIADQLAISIARHQPTSVAIIGSSGGNGLEKILPGAPPRIVAVDINAAYIERTRIRHSHRHHGLELYCADVQSVDLRYEPVELSYAALLFEYVDLRATLKTIHRNTRPGGMLTTVIQLPHSLLPAVSASPYPSLSRLEPAFRWVAPETLAGAATETGFTLTDTATLELASGKRFCVQSFRVQE